MVDVPALITTVTTALKTLSPGVTIYDGFVPDKVPTDPSGKYVLPYAVIWAGIGDNPGEQTSCGQHSTDTLIWDFQTTAVASNSDACRRVAVDAKDRLTNLRAGTGLIRPNPDGFQQQQPILDTSATPARFMLPTQWRLITN